jgi:hypothetical protein
VGEPDYEEAAEQRDIPEDEARRRFRHVQVDNGTILIELDEEHALLNLPCSPELDAEKLVEDALETLRILRAEARFVAYDPQLAREVDPDADRDAVLEAYNDAAIDARKSGDEDVVKPRFTERLWRRLRGGR